MSKRKSASATRNPGDLFTSSDNFARQDSSSRQLASEIAWLYYVKGLNQSEIAACKGLSRPTIISNLKQARSSGLVTIKLDPYHYRVNELSDQLSNTFGLDKVHVVSGHGRKKKALTEHVSEVAAHLLTEFVEPNDTLGVSWGETLSCIADFVPHWPIEGLIVRQLIGSMSSPALMTAESCTTDIARQLGGQCINMNAPAVVSSSTLAQMLREESNIATQLENLKSCNKAVFSTSMCTANCHVVQFNVATANEVAGYASRGAVCNLIGRFLDKHGEQVKGVLDDRLFAAEIEDIKQMRGMMVVAGTEKAAAAVAALRGGFASWLVVDDLLAEQILKIA